MIRYTASIYIQAFTTEREDTMPKGIVLPEQTHSNHVMQRAILKEGFRYCGIIYCWSGEERLAYQYTKE